MILYYFHALSTKVTSKMYVFDHRMIEGQPLHYFYPYEAPYLYGEPIFNQRMEIREDLVMPASPISTQVCNITRIRVSVHFLSFAE